jgi:Rrf2 family protein
MSQGILISDAASLALHAMAVIASRDGLSSARDISNRLGVSGFHLAKVLQRLAKNGLVKSTRGPRGGFALARKSGSITLLDIYEAIDGPLINKSCLMGTKSCGAHKCIMGTSIEAMRDIFKKQLSGTRISDIAGSYRQEGTR